MDVSVIMINYNTFDYSYGAIESIKKYTKGVSYEIVLIDNASADKSGARLAEAFPDVIYIASEENLGTSKAFNAGLKKCSGKYVIWLNTDVLISDDFITELYRYMESDERCGICGGNLYGADGTPAHSYRKELTSLKTVRADYCYLGRALRKIKKVLFKNKILTDHFNYTGKPKEVGYITGADMMTRKEITDKLGGFDERIFMYAEETEFTYRVKKAGYTVVSVPSAKMQHLEGASFKGKSSFSERREKLKLSGLTRYFEICFGKVEAIKYLKCVRRGELKTALIKLVLGKSEGRKAALYCRKLAGEFLTALNNGEDFSAK